MIVKSTFLACIAASLAIAAFASGCGGGGSGEADSSALTKAELIKQGDAICKKAIKREEAGLGAAYAEQKSHASQNKAKQEEELIVSVALPAVAAEANELGALSASSSEEEKISAIAEELQGAIAKAEQNPALVMEGASGPFVQFDKLAKDFGFKVCGEL